MPLTIASPNLAPSTSTTRRVLAVLRWPLGGTRTYILYHYPTLLDAGYRFTFIGPAHPVFHDFRDELSDWPSVEFVEAPHRKKSCDLRATVRQQIRTRSFDLIHSHGLTAGAEVALANLGLGVPHVVTSHDVFRKDQVQGVTGRLKLMMLGWLLGCSDGIVSVSRDAQDNLLEYIPGLARSRLVPVLNGIDTHRFITPGKSEETLRQQLGVGPDVFLMGFLGRFMEQKGFLPLLSALQQMKAQGSVRPFQLVAVGSGDYQREYQAEAERQRLSSHLTFLPFVPDVAPILRQLDVLVMPSLWEACGLLAMEAMAVGVPVVGSNCVGLREVLRDTPSRIVPANNATALAAALCEAMTDPRTEAARSFAAEACRRFSAVNAAHGLRRVFEDVLARQTR